MTGVTSSKAFNRYASASPKSPEGLSIVYVSPSQFHIARPLIYAVITGGLSAAATIGRKFRPRHRLARGGGRCDFCGTRSVARIYSCKNFEWEGKLVFTEAVGRWASCGACSALIDGKEWVGLTRRVGRVKHTSKRTRRSLRTKHALFAQNMLARRTLRVILPLYGRITLIK